MKSRLVVLFTAVIIGMAGVGLIAATDGRTEVATVQPPSTASAVVSTGPSTDTTLPRPSTFPSDSLPTQKVIPPDDPPQSEFTAMMPGVAADGSIRPYRIVLNTEGNVLGVGLPGQDIQPVGTLGRESEDPHYQSDHVVLNDLTSYYVNCVDTWVYITATDTQNPDPDTWEAGHRKTDGYWWFPALQVSFGTSPSSNLYGFHLGPMMGFGVHNYWWVNWSGYYSVAMTDIYGVHAANDPVMPHPHDIGMGFHLTESTWYRLRIKLSGPDPDNNGYYIWSGYVTNNPTDWETGADGAYCGGFSLKNAQMASTAMYWTEVNEANPQETDYLRTDYRWAEYYDAAHGQGNQIFSTGTATYQANGFRETDQHGLPPDIERYTVNERNTARYFEQGDLLFNNYPTQYTSLVGTDRYDTAIRISKAMFPGALPAGSGVVIAPGETYQEGLCGGPLAAAWGGPVLLTYQADLANNVKAELQRLNPARVYCVGLSTHAVSDVVTAVPNAYTTSITGTDAYDMGYKVAKALGAKVGDMFYEAALITRGDGDMFPDAVSVSSLACAKKWPILLTNSATGSLHAKAAQALSELGIWQAVKVGTYCTLPAGVVGIANLSGANRYDTNCNVATWADGRMFLTYDHLGFCNGEKFPDELAAGPYLGKIRGMLLLTDPYYGLMTCTSTLITNHAGGNDDARFIGVIQPTVGQVHALLD